MSLGGGFYNALGVDIIRQGGVSAVFIATRASGFEMSRLRSVLSLLVLLSIASFSLPQKSSAQMYFGLYGGADFPFDASTSARSLLIENFVNEALEDGVAISDLGISISDMEFDPGAIIGGRVGYWFESRPYLGVEAEIYSSFPAISNQDLTLDTIIAVNGSSGLVSVPVHIEEADLELLTLGLNVIARYPYSFFQPYAGVGFGLVRGTVEDVKFQEDTAIAAGASSFSFERGDDLFKLAGTDDWVPALQVKGGARTFLNDYLALFVEYRYVMTQFEFQPVQFDCNASHVLGGIEVFFSPGVWKSQPARK